MKVLDEGTAEILVGRDAAGTFVELRIGRGEAEAFEMVRLNRDEARRLTALILFQAGRLDRARTRWVVRDADRARESA